MRANRVRQCWEAGEPAVSAWLSIGNSYSAEIVGWTGVDCVVVDLQHGMTGVQAMIGMLQAISSTPATPFVRVPALDLPLLMKVLDAGAYGVICPMVDSAEQAQLFVRATSYPPRGLRSFGPTRGLLYGGPDYVAHADATLVRLAMIETAAGLAEVEAICATEGLDGIFIGPNDLGLALNAGASADPSDSRVTAAIARCAAAAKAYGKQVGIFCPSGAVAARRAAEGFGFVVPGSDANLLKAAVSAEVRLIKADRPVGAG
ncbi:2,4-dihydroxyhept-2-ene-1,7-dioic acid aldolase [Methylobacterium mesophilicum SR1.6/6]|uniref:2,4-dihydroxyhept-2-ene-1,7-dioic acid aldolase n=1 Tax=Methylobacterium mesophilicum SR1.6/6 TaxID=908290 RepID=A0A6B9FLG9_9HYPH|nr:aldolase/citrate lyase family protein [Methylobacterium mesophilicum]QGY03393.1 2,4-dihydroxyhept-2-ene-1,7-dioic acid aldolase [Methylobacterium mesophilicum SR1.6/6]